MDASRPHASQGRLSVIVVSIISGEPSDPRPTPILRLKLLSELSKGHAGKAARDDGRSVLGAHVNLEGRVFALNPVRWFVGPAWAA